jgi:hypothetical protein
MRKQKKRKKERKKRVYLTVYGDCVSVCLYRIFANTFAGAHTIAIP